LPSFRPYFINIRLNDLENLHHGIESFAIEIPPQACSLITRRFFFLAKEGLGDVVTAKSNFDIPPNRQAIQSVSSPAITLFPYPKHETPDNHPSPTNFPSVTRSLGDKKVIVGRTSRLLAAC